MPTSITDRGITMDGDEALEKLMEGNKRFVEGRAEHPRQGPERMKETLDGQEPFAVIISCSDSRVVPEIIFDAGIGDLFTIVIAGNVVDDYGLGSIEYAIDHLNTKLVVVLGHRNCGAITAVYTKAEAPGHICSLVPRLNKAVEGCPDLDSAIKKNIRVEVDMLKESEPILKNAEGLKVIGAYYDIGTGKVELI